jgi:copper chaperone CopZ
MFNLFKKKLVGTTTTLKLSGLHCASCPLNIDSELEELPGVLSATSSYPKQQSVITYDPKLVDPAKFRKVIKNLGYQVLE